MLLPVIIDGPQPSEARQSPDIVTNIVTSESIVNTATCKPDDIARDSRAYRFHPPQTSSLTVPVQPLLGHRLFT